MTNHFLHMGCDAKTSVFDSSANLRLKSTSIGGLWLTARARGSSVLLMLIHGSTVQKFSQFSQIIVIFQQIQKAKTAQRLANLENYTGSISYTHSVLSGSMLNTSAIHSNF